LILELLPSDDFLNFLRCDSSASRILKIRIPISEDVQTISNQYWQVPLYCANVASGECADVT